MLAVRVVGTRAAAGGSVGQDQTEVYVDDGVYGSFSRPETRRPPTVLRCASSAAAPCRACTVWGPTCDGLDLLCRNAALPPVREGDWLLFADMGCGTVTCSTAGFNGLHGAATAVAYVGD